MSKRHQSSRRKSYGRRQHEVRERQDRASTHHDAGVVRAGRVGRRGAVGSAGLPRPALTALPLRAGRLSMAVYEGARPRTIALPRRPRTAEPAPALPRRRARPTVRAHRSSSRPALVLGGSSSRSCSPSSRWPRRSACRPRATTSVACRSSRSGWTPAARTSRSDLSRLGREPAVRKLALDAGLGQLGEPVILPAR